MAINEAGVKQAGESENQTAANEAGNPPVADNIIKGNFSESVPTGSEPAGKGAAQNFFNEKADQITMFARQTFDKANELGNRAAGALGGSTDYVKNLDVEKVKEAVKTAVKEKPVLSIAVAGMAGLMLGLLIKRGRR